MSKKIYVTPEITVTEYNSQSVISLNLSSAQAVYKKTSVQGIGSANIIDF